jgi:alpha-L-fucosidase
MHLLFPPSTRFARVALSCLSFLAAGAAWGAPVDDAGRTAWYTAARYGLFIHWGLSSVPAGSYHGKQINRGPTTGNGLGEWIMYNAKIPVAEYAAYAKQFDPVKFDAEAWVRLAEAAGMKYIIISAKHAEGFAMFKSAASSFNIVDATPFKRDPLKELAAACARHGMRLGFYYSQAQDWHHPGGAARSPGVPMAGGDPEAGHWDKAQDGNFDDYLDRVAIPQVRELLTHYGKVSVLWWDSPVGMTPARAARLAALLKLQPGIITNNRLLDPRHPNPYSGDTETPEQFIPATGMKGRLFEVCMTMNDTWGFKAQDHNWKSASDITRKLIDVASKGGNFLLNVGPDAQGVIPAASVERLRESGKWVHANAEAIYGTTASRFRRLPWGRSTTKGDMLYLEVFDWPADGRLVVPGVKTPVARASLLASGESLPAAVDGANLILRVPPAAPDPVATVIKLEFARTPVVEQQLPEPDESGNIALPATLVEIVNAYDDNARVMGTGADAHVGGWMRAKTHLSWAFALAHPATYAVEAEVAAAAPVSIEVKGGKSPATAHLRPAGGLEHYAWVNLGEMTFDRAGDQEIELTSAGDDWKEVRLRHVRLVRR